jgi:hypothetical protein
MLFTLTGNAYAVEHLRQDTANLAFIKGYNYR